MKTQRALLALSLWLTACVPTSTTAYPPPPTEGYPGPATATVAPTAVPTTATPPTETPEPTATTEPEVWEIWFSGISCEGLALCELGPGVKLNYYSIRSDGSDLKQLDVSDFPPMQEIPAGAPPRIAPQGKVLPPQRSPDGERLLYFGQDLKLYVLDIASASWRVLFDASSDKTSISPFCWSPGGKQIHFMQIWGGVASRAPVVYRIDEDGQNLTPLFSLDGLEAARFGDCSPDGSEIVLQANNSRDAERSGLFIIKLVSGEQKQILHNHYISIPRTAVKP